MPWCATSVSRPLDCSTRYTMPRSARATPQITSSVRVAVDSSSAPVPMATEAAQPPRLAIDVPHARGRRGNPVAGGRRRQRREPHGIAGDDDEAGAVAEAGIESLRAAAHDDDASARLAADRRDGEQVRVTV